MKYLPSVSDCKYIFMCWNILVRLKNNSRVGKFFDRQETLAVQIVTLISIVTSGSMVSALQLLYLTLKLNTE